MVVSLFIIVFGGLYLILQLLFEDAGNRRYNSALRISEYKRERFREQVIDYELEQEIRSHAYMYVETAEEFLGKLSFTDNPKIESLAYSANIDFIVMVVLSQYGKISASESITFCMKVYGRGIPKELTAQNHAEMIRLLQSELRKHGVDYKVLYLPDRGDMSQSFVWEPYYIWNDGIYL